MASGHVSHPLKYPFRFGVGVVDVTQGWVRGAWETRPFFIACRVANTSMAYLDMSECVGCINPRTNVSNEFPDHYTDEQVALMLGMNPASVRRWRSKNTKFGAIKYGPPYEYRGRNVLYPKREFAAWCAAVHVDATGVPRINLPVTATVKAPPSPGYTRPADPRQMQLPVEVDD